MKLQREQRRKVPERNTGSANRDNGIKLTNKGRGLVRPRLKDCSMHTNRLLAPHPRAISQGFTNTQRLASNSHAPHRGPVRKSGFLEPCVQIEGVCSGERL